MTRKRIHRDRKTAERLIRMVRRGCCLADVYPGLDKLAYRAIMRALKMARQQGPKGGEASGL